MPPPPSEFDRDMRTLEAEIKRLEAEYNMFFAGRLPRLPWERKARVESLVRTFDRADKRNTADRFRFQTLQARFVKFLELWDRQLRVREEGGRRGKGVRAKPAPAAADAAKPAAPPTPAAPKSQPAAAPPAARELHVVSFNASASTTDHVKELYERLADAKRAVGEPPLAMDRVAALVNAQLKKHSGSAADVAFRIEVKDGKVSLSVKPTKD